MKRILHAFLWMLFPLVAIAENSSNSALSLAPPASDYSVVFLANLFGLVDGVLHGTGSQIMGQMFSVFNAAVLALGGIIIMYTLMVSTMNTAHEGQFLGQKFSSIWIPVRSTIGIALLIPKASGYCLMQIFFMWVVVQGIGAADKVWDTALGYLNRGGVIIKAQQADPARQGIAMSAAKLAPIQDAAGVILAGQVCMAGLESQLKTIRANLLEKKQKGFTSFCEGNNKILCDKPVPDFIGSVNAVAVQNAAPTAESFSVKMPNFNNNSDYAFLNGICGKITWKALKGLPGNDVISPSTTDTLKQTRAIAIDQMYLQLSNIARAMVSNDPAIGPPPPLVSGREEDKKYSPIAREQFGVPYSKENKPCDNYTSNCVIWGQDPLTKARGAPLFTGNEFLNAILAYNNAINPTLNIVNQAKDSETFKKSRQFISDASTRGWIMAGSYFFDLVQLNGDASKTEGGDINSGLEGTTFDSSKLSGSTCTFNPILCTWLENKNTKLNAILNLITGTKDAGGEVTLQQFPPTNESTPQQGQASSSVYGYINNSIIMRTPGQPGIAPPLFNMSPNFKLNPKIEPLKAQEFECGRVLFVCFGRLMGELFYNFIVVNIYNSFVTLFGEVVKSVMMGFIIAPLTTMTEIFRSGFATLTTPGVNPIVALAAMGIQYINFAGDWWINMLMIAITTMMIPIIGKSIILPLIMLGMPVIMTWMMIMAGVGFITAYYVPMLPYLIFTFGTIGWLIAVIEAMVAAPLVALGVTHPEGHDAFGKGEQALMILMNVFLRPSLMIIGFIGGIALSYVGIWVLNAGFGHAIEYLTGGAYIAPVPGQSKLGSAGFSGDYNVPGYWDNTKAGFEQGVNERGFFDKGWQAFGNAEAEQRSREAAAASIAAGKNPYTGWAGIFSFFFVLLIYTSTYLTIVQKAFTLIYYLPDKVLRWMGGQPEGIGQESAGWAEESKQKIEKAGESSQQASMEVGKKGQQVAEKGIEAGKKGIEAGAKAAAGVPPGAEVGGG
jgi:defect-in-organelle-trafficking protein DotA